MSICQLETNEKMLIRDCTSVRNKYKVKVSRMNNDIDWNSPTEVIGRGPREDMMFSRCAFGIDQHPARDQVLFVGLPCICDFVCRDAPTQQVVCLDLS